MKKKKKERNKLSRLNFAIFQAQFVNFYDSETSFEDWFADFGLSNVLSRCNLFIYFLSECRRLGHKLRTLNRIT